MRERVIAVLCGLLAVTVGTGWRLAPDRPAAPPAAGEIQVEDLAGRTVTLRPPLNRIVLVRSRDVYELSLLLGDELDRRLVAWGPDLQTADQDAYRAFLDRYPRLARIPVLGSVFADAVSAEAVLALKPDLVILDTVMSERGYRCVERLERAGLPLLYLDCSHDPLRDPQRSLRLLGKVLGQEEKARAATAFVEAELERVMGRLAGLKEPAPTVYLESGHRGVESYGNTYGYDGNRTLSSWGALMARLGCRNVAADLVASMGRINPEYLLAADPDVIVITGACWTECPGTMRLGYGVMPAEARERLQGFTRRPGWPELKAVRNGRVHSLFHGFCMHMTSFAAVQQMAKWLYPGTFADLEPAARLQEFNERFMPVRAGGTWMISLEPDRE